MFRLAASYSRTQFLRCSSSRTAGIKLLPNGVPADRTIFLPNNDAVAALLAEVPIPVRHTKCTSQQLH